MVRPTWALKVILIVQQDLTKLAQKKLEQFDRDLVSNRLLSRSPITAESTEAISENKLGQRFTLVRELLSFNIM